MPSDFVIKTVGGFHHWLVSVSKGKIGGKLLGMPVLALTTTGRKSGQPRTSMLTSPLQDGDKIMVVASKGGDDKHPAWFLNLRDEPNVEVMIDGKTRAMTAHVADATEKAELWPRIIADHSNYADYQKKTDRDIPVVILEPRA